MDTLLRDFRSALRGLMRAPGFTVVVVLTLALGIGATTGVFSAVHGVLLAAMPYPEADRLVWATATFKDSLTGFSGHDCLDYAEQTTSLSPFAAHLQFPLPLAVTGTERAENVVTTFVSVDLFRTLGVTPVLGRPFTAEDGRPAPVVSGDQPTPIPAVAIVSHSFWQRRLGGSPAVIGRSLTLAGRPVTVIGVMPEGFRFLFDIDMWLPQQLNGPFSNVRRFHNWVMVGRLKPGVSLGEAQGEVNTIAARLEKLYPESNTGMGIRLRELHGALVQRVRPALLLVTGAVALMLLIACGNVASLMLARGVTRRSELAIRTALGASRGRLVRQLVTESVVVALAGGALGLGVAAALQRLLPTLLNISRARISVDPFHLDPVVLIFALGISVLSGVAIGLVPALRSTSVSPAEELKGGARTVVSGGGARARLVLVSIQVGLSLVLLLGSALLIRSFSKLMRVELGFDPGSLLVSSLTLPSTVSNGEAVRFFDEVLNDVRAIPGVVGAGMVDRLPILQPGGSVEVWTPEHPELRSFSRQALGRQVMPGYLAAMRMPLLAGRDIAMSDTEGSPPIMVINRTMAKTLFGEENPVGRRVLVDLGDSQPTGFEVIGLVADARLNRLADEPTSTMYLSQLQYPNSRMRVVIRTAADPHAIATALRDIVARRRSDVPIDDFATMGSIIRDSTVAERALTAMVTIFALFALLLAALGLFGVLTYQVNQRRHELGVRMALGATRSRILATALRQGLEATAAGLAVGLAAGVAVTRLMAGVLYGVRPADPGSLAGAVGSLVVVALVACLLPALQASSVEPMQALRYE